METSQSTVNHPDRGYLEEHGVSHVTVDTLRYELVGEDEKIVPSDAVIGTGAAGTEGAGDGLVIEFSRFVKEHPELLLEFLTDHNAARTSVSESYEHAINYDRLVEVAEEDVTSLTEEQVMQVISLGLKRKRGSPLETDVVDVQQALFDVRSVVEKVKNPELLPKIKRLISELQLIDDKYIDMILDGKCSRKRLAFEELEKTMNSIESNQFSDQDIRSIPKHLETLDDREYAADLVDRLFESTLDHQSGDSSLSMVADLVEAAVGANSGIACRTLVDRIMRELSDTGISLSRFSFLCAEALKLCRWLLGETMLTELLEMLRSFRRFTSTEIVYADGIQIAAEDFIFEFGSGETTGQLIAVAKADFEENGRVVYETLSMLPTQPSALALCEDISCSNRSVRLMALRLLSGYGAAAIRALDVMSAGLEQPARSPAQPLLADELWYRVRNIIFVAGNIGSLEAVGLIERYVNDPDPRIAGEVITALDKTRGDKCCRLLAGYLHFNDPEVRRKAALVLGNVGDEKSLPYLCEMYESEPEMRTQLAPLIANTGGNAAIDFLFKAFSRDDSFLKSVLSKSLEVERAAIVNALSRIKTEKSLEKLKELQKQSRSGMRGFFRSNTLDNTVYNAIVRLERELYAGQNQG
jgi:HEAT repeat protein